MKKFMILGLLACVCASTAFASDNLLRIGVNVDYTMVDMTQVNAQLNTGSSVSTMGSGISGMFDLDMSFLPFIMIGARTGYLYCAPGSLNYTTLYKSTLNASLIPLEVGIGVNVKLPATPVSLMAGIYGGYGFAFASYKNDVSALGQSTSLTMPYNGNGGIGEVLAAVYFEMNSGVSFKINAGYRVAKISQMVQSQDVSGSVSVVTFPAGKKGDVLKDSNNNSMAFDFSGLNIGVGLSHSF